MQKMCCIRELLATWQEIAIKIEKQNSYSVLHSNIPLKRMWWDTTILLLNVKNRNEGSGLVIISNSWLDVFHSCMQDRICGQIKSTNVDTNKNRKWGIEKAKVMEYSTKP